MIQVSKPRKLNTYDNMPILYPINWSIDDINNCVGFNVETLFKKATNIYGESLQKDIAQKSYLRNLLIIYLKFSNVPIKDIGFIMNLSTSRVFKIINRSMLPIFGKNIEANFRSFYVLYEYKNMQPVSFEKTSSQVSFEKEIEDDIKQRFSIFVRSVIEHYLYYFSYKDEQLTSNVMRLATEYTKNNKVT
ncbi:hypothetical protein [Gilliamella sp. Bif1-4]|uniref:hypothetical protein n=1 Tax=Gilliamella sp. Bif1-4 TaxID=3120233 RepID=UPI00080D9339|nr:hypothetical protein [Gilliamella apicola]OCG40848.1 hypothetical protein A9G25_06820 [Gilliamella apicola]